MLAANKTKLICTIGPASDTPEMIRKMLDAGMNIARLNFSHGTFLWHKTAINNLRLVAKKIGKQITIMADLPGPKIRIGTLTEEPITLNRGDTFTLTTEDIVGNNERVFVNFPRLPFVLKQGDMLFLNDGIIQLEVKAVDKHDIQCHVLVGGELSSHKGLNLPHIDLNVSAFTPRDYTCLKFALENGVDAISQSFIETAADVESVRKAAAELGHTPFIIAKIERASALDHIDTILQSADGIMIARGDLGVETPLEQIALIQKQLTRKANLLGKPVITATQMLESMVSYNRPTRAEATDVANAILDGTDCVMLSEESAVGKFPVEAISILAKIATVTEKNRNEGCIRDIAPDKDRSGNDHLIDIVSHNVRNTVLHLDAIAIIIPSDTGYTARMVSRFKLPVWVLAVSSEESSCQGLQFSYGTIPVHKSKQDTDWTQFAKQWVKSEGLPMGLIVLAEGPARHNPTATHRLDIIDIRS